MKKVETEYSFTIDDVANIVNANTKEADERLAVIAERVERLECNRVHGSWICDECGRDWGDGSAIGIRDRPKNEICFCLESRGGCGAEEVLWHPAPEAETPGPHPVPEPRFCPCCGCAATIYDRLDQMDHDYYEKLYWVECNVCEMKSSEYGTVAEAVAAWDRRAEIDALASENERQRKMNKITMGERDRYRDDAMARGDHLAEANKEITNLKAKNEQLNKHCNYWIDKNDKIIAENARLRQRDFDWDTLLQEIERLKNEKYKSLGKCTWEEDRDGNWETECGHLEIINDGTPSENGMQYCSYCGRPLEEKPWKEEAE
jgi:regulator of replication initiation timing